MTVQVHKKNWVYCYNSVAVGIYTIIIGNISRSRVVKSGSNTTRKSPVQKYFQSPVHGENQRGNETVCWLGNCQRWSFFFPCAHNINERVGWSWTCSSVSATMPECLCSWIQVSIIPTLIPLGVWMCWHWGSPKLQQTNSSILKLLAFLFNQDRFFSRRYALY